MDLLGGYGDDSDEEGGSPPQEAAKPASAGGLSSLMGYAHDSGDEEGGGAGGDGEGEGGGHGGKAGENGAHSDVGPGPSSAGGNPSLSPSSSQANAGQDGTPLQSMLSKSGIRIRSKPATPSGGSPSVRAGESTGAASDVDEGGMSPMMSTPQHTAAHAIVDLLPIDPSKLPPAPEEPPNPVLLQNVDKFHKLRRSKGVTVNGDLYDKKEFHNPGILELLMTTYKIKEVGSNYPSELFDPEGYPYQLYYDALRRQDERNRAERQANRTSLDFVSTGQQPASNVVAAGIARLTGQAGLPTTGGVAAQAAAAAAAAAAAVAASGDGAAPIRKKSKWDQSSKVANVSAAQQQAALAAAAASTGVAIADFMRMQGTK